VKSFSAHSFIAFSSSSPPASSLSTENEEGESVELEIADESLSPEKLLETKLSCEAGACFVKTSTGINTTGATVADVALMKANCTEGVKVKAAGGIKTAEFAMALVEAGAERIGTSSGIAIAADLAK